MDPRRSSSGRPWPTVPATVDHRGFARRQVVGASQASREEVDEEQGYADGVYYQGQPEEITRLGGDQGLQGDPGELWGASTSPATSVAQLQASAMHSDRLGPSYRDVKPENQNNIQMLVGTRASPGRSARAARTPTNQNEEEQEEKDGDSSPSSTAPDKKKARKRPHYLSHEVRCQIIERIAGGEQQAALAREFGVTRAAVCHIQKHRFEILSRPVVQQARDEDAIATGSAQGQQLVHEVRTPSMFVLLTTLRDRRSDASSFRRAAGRAIMILIEDVLGQLDASAVEVVTASGHVAPGLERRSPLCGVTIGDEGYPFSVLFHQVEVDAAQGHIHVNRAADQRGRRYWCLNDVDLPASIASCKVLLFTATCSTGERECKAIETLCGVGTMEKDITLVSIVCASDAIVAVCNRYPQVRIVTAAIDSSVDPHTEDVIPGIGNFIARYNGDECARMNV